MPHASFSTKDFADPELCRGLLHTLQDELDAPLRFMEVCGSHTVAIFRSGLRSLLPEGITHLSGPGCPVCVTHDSEIAAFLALAEKDNVTIATFGDLMRVPGPKGMSLKQAKAQGARVQVVYSPLDALTLARQEPERHVVFLGVGFETTAPGVAATIQAAAAQKLENFSVLCCHKLVPPALEALLQTSAASQQEVGAASQGGIDAFLLPGHVSTILGVQPYAFIAQQYNTPAVVAGFDPVDILQGLLLLVRMRRQGKAEVLNQYSRVVQDNGNPRARAVMDAVFNTVDAPWRGIGLLPGSGLAIRPEYAAFDAMQRFTLTLAPTPEPKGCKCGAVLQGLLTPPQCPLFGKACTPANPVGPCMVSTEGSCAAYFAYGGL